MAATLHLVATPIGNLDDITLRALKVLSGVDLILAEDTRRTRKLLSHFDIRTPMESLHEHNEDVRAAGLVARLQAGASMALVSDAGTPLISDPGFPLVREALAAGIVVVPVPGASAVLAALTASGLPTDRFLFAGYLPRKQGPRRRFLQELAAEPGTLVLLESPRRLAAALAAAAEVLGPRPAAVARELTKMHEEIIRGTLPEVLARLEGVTVRGEVTVCIGGRAAARRAGRDGGDGAPGSGDGAPGSDEGTPGSDEGAPGSDEGTPGSDEGTPGSDEGTPGSDEGTPGSEELAAGEPTVAPTDAATSRPDRAELERRFAELQAEGMPRAAALRRLAGEHGVPRREIYRRLMVEGDARHEGPAQNDRGPAGRDEHD